MAAVLFCIQPLSLVETDYTAFPGLARAAGWALYALGGAGLSLTAALWGAIALNRTEPDARRDVRAWLGLLLWLWAWRGVALLVNIPFSGQGMGAYRKLELASALLWGSPEGLRMYIFDYPMGMMAVLLLAPFLRTAFFVPGARERRRACLPVLMGALAIGCCLSWDGDVLAAIVPELSFFSEGALLQWLPFARDAGRLLFSLLAGGLMWRWRERLGRIPGWIWLAGTAGCTALAVRLWMAGRASGMEVPLIDTANSAYLLAAGLALFGLCLRLPGRRLITSPWLERAASRGGACPVTVYIMAQILGAAFAGAALPCLGGWANALKALLLGGSLCLLCALLGRLPWIGRMARQELELDLERGPDPRREREPFTASASPGKEEGGTDTLPDANGPAQRLVYPDAARFIAMALVCCYHFPLSGIQEFGWGLGLGAVAKGALLCVRSIALPLFFLASGALQLGRPFRPQGWFRRLAGTAAQYFVWRGLTVFILMAIQGIRPGELGAAALIKGILYAAVPGLDLSYLWFIPTFIGVQLLTPAFYSALFEQEDGGRRGLALAAVLVVLNCMDGDLRALGELLPGLDAFDAASGAALMTPFPNRAGVMVFFYLAGGLLARYREKVRRLPGWALPAGATLGLALCYLNWNLTAIQTGAMFDHMLLYYTSGCALLSIAVFGLLMRLPRWGTDSVPARFFAFAGGNTLGVYYLHWIVGSWLYRAAVQALPASLPLDLAKGILVTLILSGAAMALKRIPLVGRLFRRP